MFEHKKQLVHTVANMSRTTAFTVLSTRGQKITDNGQKLDRTGAASLRQCNILTPIL